MARETHLDIDSLRGDLAKFGEQMSILADAVRSRAADAGADGYERAKRAATNTGQIVERQIERHPLTSVMTTFVAGVAVGLLLPRGERH
jgi:ElaB/YqjD/DUF883 family membrane-anchored ribosome-binding protein